MIKEIIKIIPQYKDWFLDYEFKEMKDEDHIMRIEHEVELFRDWKSEGFNSRKEATPLNGNQVRKLNGLLIKYYNN